MKQWHATLVSGAVAELERALQKIEDTDRATVVGALPGQGPYTSWTIVWYEYVPEATS